MKTFDRPRVVIIEAGLRQCAAAFPTVAGGAMKFVCTMAATNGKVR